jgi:mono/diheme cytochrome c family protein
MKKTAIHLFVAVAASIAALALPAITRAADVPPARALFTSRCGMCHQTNGMGVSILSRRTGDTSKGLLELREDISAEFVYVVVRTGTGNMPRIPRAEVTDDQLREIAIYLSRGKP